MTSPSPLSNSPIPTTSTPLLPQQFYPSVRDWSHLSEQERHRSEAEQSQIDIAAGR